MYVLELQRLVPRDQLRGSVVIYLNGVACSQDNTKVTVAQRSSVLCTKLVPLPQKVWSRAYLIQKGISVPLGLQGIFADGRRECAELTSDMVCPDCACSDSNSRFGEKQKRYVVTLVQPQKGLYPKGLVHFSATRLSQVRSALT